nr:glycosyltransferase [uncultured Allomuricauda sp.]
MKKIFFVLPSLRAGGAERVISFLANNIDPKRFKVQLIVIGGASGAAYDVSKIDTTFLNKDRVLAGTLPLLKVIKKEKPDIVMSSIGHLNVILGFLSILFPGMKFVGREASVLSTFSLFAKKKSTLNIRPLYRFAYKRLDRIVCQSKDMYDDFKKIYNLSDAQMIQIANPAPENMLLSNKKENLSKTCKFITIGRLSPEKGHLRILECLSRVNFPFTYTIIGSGIEEEGIKNEVSRLNLSGSITYVPFTKKINECLIEHDVFLQGSYVEGFPNAVVESCVSGIPVIAFDVPGGTKEIIENGVNGFLVNTIDDYVEKLDTIRQIKWDSKTIRDSIYKKYHSKIIVEKYESMFKDLLKK